VDRAQSRRGKAIRRDEGILGKSGNLLSSVADWVSVFFPFLLDPHRRPPCNTTRATQRPTSRPALTSCASSSAARPAPSFRPSTRSTARKSTSASRCSASPRFEPLFDRSCQLVRSRFPFLLRTLCSSMLLGGGGGYYTVGRSTSPFYHYSLPSPMEMVLPLVSLL